MGGLGGAGGEDVQDSSRRHAGDEVEVRWCLVIGLLLQIQGASASGSETSPVAQSEKHD